MKINSYKLEDKEPSFISEKYTNSVKLIKYLAETKDENFIKGSSIERIDIFDDVFFKVYFKSEMIVIDLPSIAWLETHHYIRAAKYHKEECEKFWDIVKDKVDMYLIEDWNVKRDRSLIDNEVTYDRKTIYVKGKPVGIKFTVDFYKFVVKNKQKWY